MLEIKVNEGLYRVKNTWSDITIEDAAKVASLKMPDTLADLYLVAYQSFGLDDQEKDRRIISAQEAISIEDQFKKIPKYYGEVLEILSDIPHEVVLNISSPSITTLYMQYLRSMVEGILYYPPDFSAGELEYFDFKGERYYLPASKEIMGRRVPMVDLTALEFTESADILIALSAMNKDRDLMLLCNLISILCRPKDEKYDEMKSNERAKEFKDLTLDIVWNVFFSLITPLLILKQFDQISLLEKAVRKAREKMSYNPSAGTGKS